MPASGQKKAPQQRVMRGATLPSADRPQTGTADNIPVETPDLPKLPFKMVDGVKEFNLVAEPVRTEFLPGRVVDAWGFNGSVPGPTIEVTQGDRVRVIFDNHLPEMTAVHWHGFEVPMEMDGSVGLGQDPVPPGGRYVYEFTLHQEGTFFYHSHFAMQEMMGMLGLFIMHPKAPYEPRVDRDFAIILQEWALLPNNTVPNTLAMEFNWLTFNGKAGPATTPMIVKQGERVRIRMINIGMDHHPIHLHGNTFVVTGTEAGRSPENTWVNQNTVLVGVAQARDIEFDAKLAGDWMLHCHLPHHMMNQMMSMVGPISHGGMGMHTGGGMEEGMGIVRQGNALSEEMGPAFGRGLGVGADADRMTSNLVRNDAAKMMAGASAKPTGSPDEHPALLNSPAPAQAAVYTCPMHAEVRETAPGKCPKCGMTLVPAKPQAPSVHEGHNMPGMPGHNMNDPAMDMYPKDDPAKYRVPGYPQDMWMPMDEMFNGKPELYGLRKGWSGAMMGMMTLVRTVTPEVYDKIMDLKEKSRKEPAKAAPMQHQHGK
ncbi:MAG TPA: multicopper oxidase domain-containing protein [Bryobacteraceae bacterium]|nr:multicopper oxidase domain-containing protein [Bryobacteraceae bacterium]